MKYTLPYESNQDWTDDPATVVVDIKGLPGMVKAARKAMKALGADVMVFWCAAGYKFLDEDGAPFEPDYRIEGCDLKVYEWGPVQFVFRFKNTGDEGWADMPMKHRGVK